MAIEDAVEHIQSFAGHSSSGTLAKEYTVNGSFSVNGPNVDRHGAYYVSFGDGDYIAKWDNASRTERYFHFAMLYTGLTSSDQVFFQTGENAVAHVRLRMIFDGTLEAQRGSTFIASSSGAGIQLLANVWYWVAIWVLVDDTNGRVVVKVNGNTAIDFTGDTRNGGAGVQSHWWIGDLSSGATITWIMTDLVVLNGDHADADFLPDCRVDSLFPDGDGDSLQGVPSTGTAHYALVDENPGYSEADYVSFQAAGDDDLYTLPSLTPGGGLVYGVAVISHMAKSDVGDCNMQNQLKAGGGTVVGGASRALSVTSLMYYDWFPDVPGGAGWTESDVNALQSGVNRTL